jgi:hypothetical protein
MSKLPEFYELEYFSDADFWSRGEASMRRAVIVPLTDSEFLGFGVLGSSNEVLFMARGRVDEHQQGFIARMEQAGASVEFRAQRPVSRLVLKA